MGHLQTCPVQYDMSASPLKADIGASGRRSARPIGDIDERPHTQHAGCKFVNAPSAKQAAILARSRQAQLVDVLNTPFFGRDGHEIVVLQYQRLIWLSGSLFGDGPSGDNKSRAWS
jgi:hypothetical protein